MLNVVVVFVVGFGGGDDDDVGRQLFFFDVHLSVTCECKSCSKGGACFCVFFFFSFLSVASSALFVKAWEARRNGGCGWPLAMSSPKTARLHFSVGETKAAFGNEEDEEGGKAHGNV